METVKKPGKDLQVIVMVCPKGRVKYTGKGSLPTS